ncbi:hypothetical protein BDV06DRAFT_122899 [Aspergillus oleicola]
MGRHEWIEFGKSRRLMGAGEQLAKLPQLGFWGAVGGVQWFSQSDRPRSREMALPLRIAALQHSLTCRLGMPGTVNPTIYQCPIDGGCRSPNRRTSLVSSCSQLPGCDYYFTDFDLGYTEYGVAHMWGDAGCSMHNLLFSYQVSADLRPTKVPVTGGLAFGIQRK